MTNLRRHLLLAAIVGLALRLFFVLHFPATAGDTPVYEELAANWLKHGLYGLGASGHLAPTDMRVPGYPAFLVFIYALSGRTGAASRLFVMLSQVAIDLGTCFIAAALTYIAAPKGQRSRMAIVAMWFAATCPFLATYVAVPLTETLATFFTTLALLFFVVAMIYCGTPGNSFGSAYLESFSPHSPMLGAFFVGIATLLRPESPLLLIAYGLILAWQMRDPRHWRHLLLRVAAMTSLFLIPLLPWAARNAVTLHKLQFLAPRYAQLPSEIVPMGFYAWEKTWLTRMRDTYLVSWKLDEEEIRIQDLPDSAFDSPEERARVAALLAKHNQAYVMSKEIDDGFAALAAERTARHPLRTYLSVPFRRVLTIWFTPRIELLPYSGHVFPFRASWEEDHMDFLATIASFLLNLIYVVLALIGAWRAWHWSAGNSASSRRAIALMAIFIVIRTAFLAGIESPEPRYVLECFPAVLAMAAFSFLPRAQDEWLRGKSAEIVL